MTPNAARTVSYKAWNSSPEYPSWVAKCDIKGSDGTMLNPIFWKKVHTHRKAKSVIIINTILSSINWLHSCHIVSKYYDVSFNTKPILQRLKVTGNPRADKTQRFRWYWHWTPKIWLSGFDFKLVWISILLPHLWNTNPTLDGYNSPVRVYMISLTRFTFRLFYWISFQRSIWTLSRIVHNMIMTTGDTPSHPDFKFTKGSSHVVLKRVIAHLWCVSW